MESFEATSRVNKKEGVNFPMAIISGRGGAPGSFIYEGAIASQGARASFNTVYMMVDAPEESINPHIPIQSSYRDFVSE